MFAIKSNIVWFLLILHVSYCQRRIQNGQDIEGDKPYAVYLVKAPMARSAYDEWLCGGALVTTLYVVTSAACIMDVDFLYVIAGYKKYVPDREIDTDSCTSQMKKKVIYTCHPAAYKLNYAQPDKWAYVDIGVAKVESPYDVADETFKHICSYIPGTIPISFETKDQLVGNDAIILGWGHASMWRKVTDNKNHNKPVLKYAPVSLMDKEECKQAFLDIGDMPNVIEKYMICTNSTGFMDEHGVEIKPQKLRMGYERCSKRKSLGYNSEDLEDCDEEEVETRRQIKESYHSSNESVIEIRNKSGIFNNTIRASRRNGICQNDHGGPLVTWAGGHEVLIGVASVFRVTEEYKCIGPYLYTSTQCNGAFLDCILSQHSIKVTHNKGANSDTRRAVCKTSAREMGYDTVERHISWLYHPAGAADHEKHLIQEKNKSDENKQVKRINENKPTLNENPTNNMDPPNNINPINNMNPTNNMNQPNNMNPTNNMNPPNNMNPTNNMNLAFNRDISSVYVKDAINERYGTNT